MATTNENQATLAARRCSAGLRELLEGSHPAWPPFFEEHGLAPAPRGALERAEADVARPAPAPDLVEALRYFGPDDALVLIMGVAAPGGCRFSTLAKTPPDATTLPRGALRSIIDNLEAQGLARHHYRVEGDPSSGQEYCGDLRTWAAQGVLLMDNALTTTRVGAHGNYWKAFTTTFVRALTAHVSGRGRRLICMFWGVDACAFAPAAEGATVYHWTCPSLAKSPATPLIDNCLPPVSNFESAPHFADANTALRAAGLRPIMWDPLGYTFAFTDGSCLRNGKPDAEASYAAYILTGPLKGVEVGGRVEPLEYAFVDPADPLRGFVPVPGKAAIPTNNRGEYLAWCWILLLLLRGGVRGRIQVVSDCSLFIKTMEVWLPARRRSKKAKPAARLKNYDLVCIGEALLEALRAAALGVALTHVYSHQKPPPPEAGAQARVFWYGNDRVDRAAAEVLANYLHRDGPAFILAAAPPIAWRIHGRY